MRPDALKPIIDALIFASDMPLSIARMRQIIQEVGQEDIAVSAVNAVIEQLNADNRDSQRGFYLQEVAGGYQYRTRPNYAPWIKKLKKSKAFRLTQSTLETLAIIAYKQPIIRTDIEKLRGVDSGGVIKNLIERSLIKIVGRKNIPGRPFMFGTTRRFLEVFGLDRLEDLPSLKEFDGLDESKLPTILRQKIPPELFDLASQAADDEEEAREAEPVTDEQLSEADRAAERFEYEDDDSDGTDDAAEMPSDCESSDSSAAATESDTREAP
ncbi:MAG: SMC-Scp complex subunit ScpB [Deltaproteobacteria bacterium]|nr:SMC-Scp complex subunit ScpB [Deltaproteobacteria bacterium]